MIKNINVSTPVRVDLCGGTLDIWPLNLIFEESRTINLAVNACCKVQLRVNIPEPHEKLTLSDAGGAGLSLEFFQVTASGTLQNVAQAEWPTIEEFWQQPREQVADLFLIPYTILKYFKPRGVAAQLKVITEAPVKSGLAGSSSLMVALTQAFETAFRPFAPSDSENLILLCRDLEASVMQFMAGIQDYYPAVYGGLNSIYLPPQKAVLKRFPQSTFDWVQSKIFVVDSQSAHHSGATNWQVIKALLDGDQKIRGHLQQINKVTQQFYTDLGQHNFVACAAGMNAEWEARKQLSALTNTAKIDEIIRVGSQVSGVKAAKVCGAGNGGCVIFWVEDTHPEWQQLMIQSLKHLEVAFPAIKPTQEGLQVTSYCEEGNHL